MLVVTLVSSVGSLGGAVGRVGVGSTDTDSSPRGGAATGFPVPAHPVSAISVAAMRASGIFVTVAWTRLDLRRFRQTGRRPGSGLPGRRSVRDGSAEADLHGGAVDVDDPDLDADGGELDAVVRQLLVEVLLGVVEQRLRGLAPDVAGLAVDVQRERVGLLEAERRVVHLDACPPGQALDGV